MRWLICGPFEGLADRADTMLSYQRNILKGLSVENPMTILGSETICGIGNLFLKTLAGHFEYRI